MGLSQSLYTGWSGMATHQRALDNLSNNLANVNNVGYRKSDFHFSNLMNKSISGSMAAGDNHSTINGKAVGLGVATGAITTNFTSGPIETTNNPLDVAIAGAGFFVVSTASGIALTRGGSFYTDHTVSPNERMLCVGKGLPVQGWMAENGVITPSQDTVGNIYLPADGDMMPGRNTTKVTLTGRLPSNPDASDLAGHPTTSVDLKGNLSGNDSLVTSIYVPVTRTGSDNNIRDEMQEVKVRIDFTGPTLSPDGSVNSYSWTMKTVDWPNAGDPETQIYPPPDNPQFNQDTVRFYTTATDRRGAGQAVDGAVSPGQTTVRTEMPDGQGGTITTSFTIPADFELDVTRLTNLDSAPGGNALEAWHVNGNPEGSMSRTVRVFDEYTEFVPSTDANGNAILVPERRVAARDDTLYFTRTEMGDGTTTWTWRSSLDDASGELRFNSIGDLTSSTSSGGRLEYDFGDITYNNSTGSIQIAGQDGYVDGFLREIRIDQNGKVWGHYSNDVTEQLAQLAIGNVVNPAGLEGVSGNLFYPGVASGGLVIGTPGENGFSTLHTSSLEGSNTSLAGEFTNIINYERGYQINGRIITTSDEMLQTALQLKR